jgi:hypothetical protein
MSLFMDVHTIEGGGSAEDVAGAHIKDLETQQKYQVSYLRCWVDEEAGKIFCLVEAESAEDANTVHREAHGLLQTRSTRSANTADVSKSETQLPSKNSEANRRNNEKNDHNVGFGRNNGAGLCVSRSGRA